MAVLRGSTEALISYLIYKMTVIYSYTHLYIVIYLYMLYNSYTMLKPDETTIRVKIRTRDKLKKFIKEKGETYDDIIWRFMEAVKK